MIRVCVRKKYVAIATVWFSAAIGAATCRHGARENIVCQTLNNVLDGRNLCTGNSFFFIIDKVEPDLLRFGELVELVFA